MTGFTHMDTEGRVRMVDVTAKEVTDRTAVARGAIAMQPDTLEKILAGAVTKGNVLETARIAGVMAAKKTSDLVPMCHPLPLTHVRIDFFPDRATHSIRIEAGTRLVGRTGVEMEALTAVTVAALTIYDMCKSHDREMSITDVRLVEKSGGKSGHYVRRE
jgi:cyclic pyranopterin monophosphate synthase